MKITQIKSQIGYSKKLKDTVRALGLRGLGQTVDVPDNPSVRGMLRKIGHLVKVEGN